MYDVMNNYTKYSSFLSATLIFCECLITELLYLPLILGYVLENSGLHYLSFSLYRPIN